MEAYKTYVQIESQKTRNEIKSQNDKMDKLEKMLEQILAAIAASNENKSDKKSLLGLIDSKG